MGALERARVARRGRLGGGGAGQPAFRLPVERRARRAGGGDRHRGPRRAHGLLGAAVRNAGLGRGAARARRRRRRPPPSPPRTRRPVTRASRDGPRPARAHAHRATELEVDPRYDACEPGYASFVEALGSVYCGDLDRYVELTGAVAQRYGQRSGLRLGLLRRRPPVVRPDRGGTRAHRGVRRRRAGRSATPTGSPTRCGSRGWRSPRRTCAARSRRGTRASTSCASTASSSSRASSPATPPACTPPTAKPEAALVLFAEAIAAFQRAGNVPQLIITLASVPALFERLDRLAPAAMLLGALSREPSSLHHVPELGRHRRPRRPHARASSARRS